MSEKGLNPTAISGRVHRHILQLLEEYPGGLQWSDLAARVKTHDPSVHPKTLNGLIWRLCETFPDRVYKPAKGRFRLVKYKQ